MKTTGIIRRFDSVGRVVIPKEIRERIWGTKNTDDMPVEFFLDGNSVVLKKYEEKASATEQEIRDKAIEEFSKEVLKQIGEFEDIHGYPSYGDCLRIMQGTVKQMKGGE